VKKSQRLLIVDDHPLFREGLKAIIARSARFEIVAEAGTARNGLQKAVELKPDLVIVDISLPDRSGIDLTRDIRSQLVAARVLIVSMHARVDYIVEAFQAGATGYVVKESAADRLLQALEVVSAGEYYLDSGISREVVQRLMNVQAGAAAGHAAYGRLTRREQEVMRRLAEGYSPRQVADGLGISVKTVENHRSNILRKLGLSGTMELVRYAARIGLIDLQSWSR
jgi:DNA-binding NarL/FixJ family response regulator